MGAEVVRWDAPVAVDCPPESIAEATTALSAGKLTVPTDDAWKTCAEADLVLFDSLDEDAFDGVWTRPSQKVRDMLDPSTPVVDIGAIRTGTDPGDWLPASSLTVSAFAGMSWAIGAKDKAPLALPYDIPGYLAGVEAAGAACLALLTREFGVRGGRWDLSEADVVATYVGHICSNFVHYGRPWARDGARASASGGFYPAAMFRCRDGFVSLFCRTNREWSNLVKAMGSPEWAQQPGFDDGRVVAAHHADEVDVHLKAWVAAQTSDEINRRAVEFGFPIARVLSINEAREQDQFAERGLIREVGAGRRVSGRPWVVHRAPSPAPPRPRKLELHSVEDAPLTGLRVLDLTWVWSGPMLTAALADLGARVVKVEGVRRPDPSRLRGAAIRDGKPVPGPDLELSPYFNQMNRGKLSVGIDITTDRGADLVRALAANSDVVVENMRPGALDRRGLGYADLRKENPGLVMLSMSMMGQTGPMRLVGGYAPVMSGLTGLDSLVGYSPDELIGLYNPALGDPNGAAHGLALLLAALRQRAVTGDGAWLDLAQVECLMSILRIPVMLADGADPVPPPANGHGTFEPHGVFRCRGEDSWLAIAARTDLERQALARALGMNEVPMAGLTLAVEEWCAAHAPEDAARLLTDQGVPAAVVNGIAAVESSTWAAARDLRRPTTHRYLGEQLTWGVSWKRQGLSYPPHRASPLFGEHTRHVLAAELRISSQELDELVESGVLAAQDT